MLLSVFRYTEHKSLLFLNNWILTQYRFVMQIEISSLFWGKLVTICPVYKTRFVFLDAIKMIEIRTLHMTVRFPTGTKTGQIICQRKNAHSWAKLFNVKEIDS